MPTIEVRLKRLEARSRVMLLASFFCGAAFACMLATAATPPIGRDVHVVKNAYGDIIASLRVVDDRPGLVFFHENKPRMTLGLTSQGDPFLVMYGRNGVQRLGLAVDSEENATVIATSKDGRHDARLKGAGTGAVVGVMTDEEVQAVLGVNKNTFAIRGRDTVLLEGAIRRETTPTRDVSK